MNEWAGKTSCDWSVWKQKSLLLRSANFDCDNTQPAQAADLLILFFIHNFNSWLTGYGSVIMLKINWPVNQLLQLILTYIIATVEDILLYMPVAFHTDQPIIWKQVGKEIKEEVILSSLVCLFAVIFCSMGPVNVKIISAINTAQSCQCSLVEMLKTLVFTFDLQVYFQVQYDLL